MKIGILASPTINLSHVFFNDYHKDFQDLSLSSDVFLAGSVSEVPGYARDFVPLPISYNKGSTFGMVNYVSRSRYMMLASNNSRAFSYLRKSMEARNDNLVKRRSIRLFAKNDVDIIYSLPFYPDLSAIAVAKKLRKPLVVEFWEDQMCLRFEWYNHQRIPRKATTKEIKRGYAWLRTVSTSANHNVVPTRVLKDRLVRFGVEEEKISIIPVCTNSFAEGDPEKVRRLYGIGQKKVIFSLGSLSAYHDTVCLLNSLNKLKSRDCVLIIAGGWHNAFKQYERIAQSVDIPVHYVGRLSPLSLENHLSCADVCVASYRFAYPSGFFPATVIRYMLAGKAIAVTDLPEIREMFKGSKACLLVRQRDPDALAEAIDFLLENEEIRNEMGAQARIIASNNYLWQNHTEKLKEVFTKIC